jgi:biopolymer transport protein ExbD
MAEIATNTRVARVDMTPMVDLGFLLITFFMFTTSFYQEYVVRLNMPDRDTSKPPFIKVSNSLTLILGKDNKLLWYQQEVKDLNTSNLIEIDYGIELRKLIVQKRNAAVEIEKFSVIIKPTDESIYQNTIDALDDMILSNQDRYVLADITPNEKLVYEARLKP